MDDDGATSSAVLLGVGEVEADGQLEVELDRGALVLAAEGVEDVDVDLGAVEGTISGVELPATLAGVVVELGLEGGLGGVPGLDVTEVLLRGAGGELEAGGQMREEGRGGARQRT